MTKSIHSNNKLNFNTIFRNETIYVSIIFIFLIVIFSNDIIFFGEYYLANDYLYSFPPWNRYVPSEFGNFNAIMEDQAFNIDPYRRYLIENYQNLSPPLWNSDTFAGAPFISDGNFHFNPILLFSYLFPLGIGSNIIFILKLFIAGFGSYFFLRELKCNQFSSLAAAITFMFSGSMILLSGTHTVTSVVMMLPLLFLFTHRIAKNASWKNFVFLSLSIAGLLLNGHIESSIIFLYAVIFYFIFQMLVKIKNQEVKIHFKQPIIFSGALGLGSLISSIHLITFGDYLFRSMLWLERNVRGPSSLVSENHIISNLLPEFFGRPTYAWWGVSTFNAINFNHVGIVAILLALIGSIFLFKRNHEVKFFAIASILFFGFNYSLPIAKNIFVSLPPMNFVPIYFSALILAFFLSVLVGFGVNHVVSTGLKFPKKTIIITLIITIFFISIAVFFTFSSLENPPSSFWISESPISKGNVSVPPPVFYDSMKSELIIFLILIISTAVFILLTIFKKISIRNFQIMIIIILTVSMFEFGMSYASTTNDEKAPTTPAIDFLKNDSSLHRIFPTGVILQPDSHLNYGFSSIKGNDLLRIPSYVELFRSTGDVRTKLDFISTDYSSTILNLLNVKYVLINSHQTPLESNGRYELVFEDDSVKVLENTQVLPRAFLVHDFIEILPENPSKNWSDFKFLKGWIKGSGNDNYFDFVIYGPTLNDSLKFKISDDSKDWKEFLLDIRSPEEIIGNPNLEQAIQMEIMGPSLSEKDGFKIKELQLTNEFLKIGEPDKQLWSKLEFTGGNLNCNFVNSQDDTTTIRIMPGGNNVECAFKSDFSKPTDFSKYRIFEFWMDNNWVYEIYIFGPTMNDFYRYDVYQHSPGHLSKVNVNLNSPIEVHGNPDLSNVIQLRIDPATGKSPGQFTITEPILHQSNPIDILYKSHHLQQEKNENQNNKCRILDQSQKVGPIDPKFISKLPTHQPKDLFYFDKLEQEFGSVCKLTLIPKYSETLIKLQDPNFENDKQIIINDKIDNAIKNKISNLKQTNEVTVLKYENQFQRFDVSTEQPGFLFVSDTYDPGWNAYIDDKQTKIYRTDWTFRSIFVPAGEHIIEFKYEPDSLLIGALTTFSGLSIIIIGTIIQKIKK